MSNMQTPELDIVSDRLVELAKYWLTEDNRFTAAGTSTWLPPRAIGTASQDVRGDLLQVTSYLSRSINSELADLNIFQVQLNLAMLYLPSTANSPSTLRAPARLYRSPNSSTADLKSR